MQSAQSGNDIQKKRIAYLITCCITCVTMTTEASKIARTVVDSLFLPNMVAIEAQLSCKSRDAISPTMYTQTTTTISYGA